MPWREAVSVGQRMPFIADHLRDVLSIAELCALCGVSSKIGARIAPRIGSPTRSSVNTPTGHLC